MQQLLSLNWGCSGIIIRRGRDDDDVFLRNRRWIEIDNIQDTGDGLAVE